jgi:DNA ligase-associated metallophosphoesterase
MLQLKPERFAVEEFRSQPVSIGGKALVADQSGAVYWPGHRALIAADLDMESPRSQAGPLPRIPDRINGLSGTLIRLAEAIDRYEPETVVVLGGNCHEAYADRRMTDRERAVLDMMQEDRRWIWIADGATSGTGHALGGEILPELALDPVVLRHRPRAVHGSHEIAGHLRPAACVSIYGTKLRRPCFVSDGLRLILPAFGSLAGGQNVLGDAFQGLLGTRGLMVWMLGEEGLYPIAARLLRGD